MARIEYPYGRKDGQAHPVAWVIADPEEVYQAAKWIIAHPDPEDDALITAGTPWSWGFAIAKQLQVYTGEFYGKRFDAQVKRMLNRLAEEHELVKVATRGGLYPDGSGNYTRDPMFYTRAAWDAATLAAEVKREHERETARRWADVRDRLNAAGYPVSSGGSSPQLELAVWQRLLRDVEAYDKIIAGRGAS